MNKLLNLEDEFKLIDSEVFLKTEENRLLNIQFDLIEFQGSHKGTIDDLNYGYITDAKIHISGAISRIRSVRESIKNRKGD